LLRFPERAKNDILDVSGRVSRADALSIRPYSLLKTMPKPEGLKSDLHSVLGRVDRVQSTSYAIMRSKQQNQG
jgi:hypothetical protein